MTPYLIVLGIAGLGVILWMARRAGADSVKADIGERDAKTAAKVADAVAAAPDSLSDVRRNVLDGGKL